MTALLDARPARSGPHPQAAAPAAPSSRPATSPSPIRLGETTVDALRGVSLSVDGRRVRRAHGPVGQRQEHAPAAPRRARPADHRRGRSSRARSISHLSDDRGHAAAPRPDRVRLPVVQPHPAPRRHRERRPAVHDRRPGPVARRARRADPRRHRARRPRRQGAPQARPAVGRRAAAGRRRPRARDPPGAPLRRRADRQPRLHDRHRDPRRALALLRRARARPIVLVTHDSKAAAYADRVLVVGDGRIRDDDRARPARRPRRDRRSSAGSPSSGSEAGRRCADCTRSPGAASRARRCGPA